MTSTPESRDRLDYLDDVASEALAREHLLDFADRTYPGFESPAHIRLITGLLERVERGELKRLMINVPVRHGKSVLASQNYPAWYLGRHPRHEVVLASHSEDLAVRNSRVAKSLLLDQRWPFTVELARDSTAAGRWNTKDGGGCYAIGVGGAITGRGAHMLLIDDALHDGLSETERESAWRWYSEVAVPRLEPGGAVVMIGARFSDDDLCGRILESEDGPNWTVVSLPALAEEDDPLGRAVGEALWPERMGVAELDSRRVQMGSRAFAAQFQQDPASDSGGTFSLEFFQHRYSALPQAKRWVPITTAMLDSQPWRNRSEMVQVDATLTVVQAVDCASKTEVSHDWSVIATVGTDSRDFYIMDIVRVKVQFTDLKRQMHEAYAKHAPRLVFIEDASSGIPLIQELKLTTSMPIVAVKPHGTSKYARAAAIAPTFEAGRVFLPERAPWVETLIDEFVRFGEGCRWDDQVDAVCMAIANLREQIARQAAQNQAHRRLAAANGGGGWMFR